MGSEENEGEAPEAAVDVELSHPRGEVAPLGGSDGSSAIGTSSVPADTQSKIPKETALLPVPVPVEQMDNEQIQSLLSQDDEFNLYFNQLPQVREAMELQQEMMKSNHDQAVKNR